MGMEGRVKCEGGFMLIILPIIVSILIIFLDILAIIFADVNHSRSPEGEIAAIVIVISGVLILFHIWRSYFAFISQVGGGVY